MTDEDTLHSCPPWRTQPLLSERELEALRQRAWQEQNILIVSPYDDRLAFSEKTKLCEIGNRFYGSDTDNE